MFKIPLTQGKFAIVDEEDYERFSKYKWHITTNRKEKPNSYATRNICGGKKLKMHQEILDIPENLTIDHINRNGLDNRRSNLRIVTPSENRWNTTRLPTHNRSGARGVRWNKKDRKWRAIMWFLNNSIFLGSFDSKEEASWAYKTAIKLREIFYKKAVKILKKQEGR